MAPRIPDGERIYAIGDVHGCLDKLETLIGLIRHDNAGRDPARVRLILVGDIVNRGPNSAEVVRRCMALSRRTDRFIILKGNHEALMVESLAGDFTALGFWLRDGGEATLLSWGIAADLIAEGPSTELLRTARASIPADVLGWLDKLPLHCRAGDYLFVHAGIRPGVPLAAQVAQDLLWIRHEFLGSDADHGCVVVHGHSISENGIVTRPNRIGIDTGAYRTGILTALALEGDRSWSLATDGKSC